MHIKYTVSVQLVVSIRDTAFNCKDQSQLTTRFTVSGASSVLLHSLFIHEKLSRNGLK